MFDCERMDFLIEKTRIFHKKHFYFNKCTFLHISLEILQFELNIQINYFIFQFPSCHPVLIITTIYLSILLLVIWALVNHVCCINLQKKNVRKFIVILLINLLIPLKIGNLSYG